MTVIVSRPCIEKGNRKVLPVFGVDCLGYRVRLAVSGETDEIGEEVEIHLHAAAQRIQGSV